MEFRILGPTEVLERGTAVQLGPRRQRILLSLLLAYANQVVSTNRLIETLWPQATRANAVAMLHVRISELRKALRGARLDGPELIVTHRPGYRLALADIDTLDAQRFDQLAGEGRRAVERGQPALARTLFDQALALWRGPPFPDLSHIPFAEPECARLDELHLRIIEDGIDADLACGRHATVCAELEALVVKYPWRENLWRQLMLARYRSGRQAEALSAYHELRTSMVDTLGIEPGQQLRDLYRAMLRHSAELLVLAQRYDETTNLKAPVSTFVGRDVELAAITALLQHGRLVTLLGVGGAGKSRLALEVATANRKKFPDGCWLVELSNISDHRLLADAIAGAIGIREHPEKPTPDVLAEHLRAATALLILDNCEHLLNQVAALAHELLGTCQHVCILATSRERIGITGESILLVRGLELSASTGPENDVMSGSAVRLFVERATAVRPTFRMVGSAIVAVQQICQRLDGLPLAIELAAARMSALSAEQIASRLDDRFALLVRGERTALRHHQTLTAVLDWSYNLLNGPERQLFNRLAVFIGGFDIHAAQSICSSQVDSDISDLVFRLVDQSLVTVEEANVMSPRYGLLETVRAYGQRRLGDGASFRRIRARHASHYHELAKTAVAAFRGNKEAEWLMRLEAEHGNLRLALEWRIEGRETEAALSLAGSLHHFWDLHGHYREGRRWLRQALDLEGVALPATRARACYGMAELAMIQGDFIEASDFFQKALELFQLVADTEGLADCTRYLGFIAICSDELADAANLLTESLANAQTAGSAYAEGWSLLFLGVLALAQRNFTLMAQLSAQSEHVLQLVGQREGIGWAFLLQGVAAWGNGDFHAAANSIRQGIEMFEVTVGLWGMSLGLLFTALLARARECWPATARLLGASEAIRDSIGAASLPFLAQWFIEAANEAKAALGTEAFDAEWQIGAAADLEGYLADARRQLH